MGLNNTPNSERVSIGFFGLRNAGKSSLVNAVTGQNFAVVSDVLGTTTDALGKNMELLPLGPVTIVDTPGIDDEGSLGKLRVEAAKKALRRCDIAVLVTASASGLAPAEEELLGLIHAREIPYVIARNKSDLLGATAQANLPENEQWVSAKTGAGIQELKELIAAFAKENVREKCLVADLLTPGSVVVLVIPIDASAPKARIILPQQMVLRDCLDAHASCVACQVEELAGVLAGLVQAPRLVVTDSQAFAEVAAIVPQDVQLTSFSILMARYKGNLAQLAAGAQALAHLTDESRVLISEGCTHHRQCEDIGTVKMPAWIKKYSGACPHFEFTSGNGFPEDLSPYSLVVHCGACMLNAREMEFRMALARQQGVPMVNYGMAIAQMNGILDRALAPVL
jgi:[FeFe] hydrogenase H-cluster maturation GTPase HydF